MRNKKILIIDDDVELCEEIAEMLRIEGFYVDNISDNEKAQQKIEKENFDVVILDYKMPGLNGIEMAKLIKTRTPDTHVFLTSGRFFLDKLVEEEKAQHLVSGILNKPFDAENLLNKIQGLFNK